jgi:hypothetical protein
MRTRFTGVESGADYDADIGGRLRRDRSRRGLRRGAWRIGGAVLAVGYSLMVWGALFQGVPRVVAWLGQRQASAEQPAPQPAPPPAER